MGIEELETLKSNKVGLRLVRSGKVCWTLMAFSCLMSYVNTVLQALPNNIRCLRLGT